MELTTRRSFLVQLSAATLAGGRRIRAREPDGLLFAGTYTDKGSTSQGIYAYRWDPDSGTMAPLRLVAKTVNPSFLALSPNRRRLYAKRLAISPSIRATNGWWLPTRTRRMSSSLPAMRDLGF